MRLIDTSAWIETLIGSPAGERIMKLLPAQDRWLVPTIVQLELAKWLRREAAHAADQVIAFSQLCRVVPLDTETALAAAELGATHRLATADAIIYATARAHGADLLTCDAHFDGLQGVIFP
jgi:predicted nucleic acid-binding protein